MNTRDAVARYVPDPHDPPTRDELIQAAVNAAEWRYYGPLATAEVVRALHDDHNVPYREIELLTTDLSNPKIRIDHVTAERLAEKGRSV